MAPKRQPIKHGTLYAYKARGCRCKKCRRANADACRDYNRSRGAVPAGAAARSDSAIEGHRQRGGLTAPGNWDPLRANP